MPMSKNFYSDTSQPTPHSCIFLFYGVLFFSTVNKTTPPSFKRVCCLLKVNNIVFKQK